MFISEMRELEEKFQSWKDRQPAHLSRYSEYNSNDNVIARVLRQEGKDTLEDYYFGANLVVETGEQYYVRKMSDTTLVNDFAAGSMVLNNPSTADTIASTDDFSDVTDPISGSYSSVESISITSGGTGYVDQESVTITGVTSTASNATATVDVTAGAITAFTMTAGGSGYEDGESLTIAGAGSSDAVTTCNTPKLTSVALNNSDSGNAGGGEFIITWKQSYSAVSFSATSPEIKGGAILATSTPGATEPILNHWNFGSIFTKQATEPLDVWVNHDLTGV